MKTIYWIPILALVSACGESPTSPTPAPQPPQPQVVAEAPKAPEPEPEPPAPEPPKPEPPQPEPPKPAPVPEPPKPAPTPEPPKTAPTAFDGTTTNALWFADAVLPAKFSLTIANRTVEANGKTFPVLTAAPNNVYVLAGVNNLETLTIEYHGGQDWTGSWSWTYDGRSGHATGTLSPKR